MSVGARAAAALALALVASTWVGPSPAWAESADGAALVQGLLDGAEAVLRGEKRAGLAALGRAAILSGEEADVQGALGAGALSLGDRTTAKRVLARVPRFATYLAMAEHDGAGGLSRAQTTLVRHAALDDRSVEPSALFLLALAFERAGDREKAHQHLRRALTLARSTVDEAFAPDPAVAMARAVLRVAAREGQEDRAIGRLAPALFAAGRRGEATRLAEQALSRPATRTAGLRVLVLVENAAEARRALSRVERVLAEEPSAEDAKVARFVLLVRLGEKARAEKLLDALGAVTDRGLEVDLERARAELLLGSGRDVDAALEAAEAAVRADPKSDEAVAVLVRALLAAKKHDRAEAFAGALLRRRPRAVDPYALLAEVAEAKGQTSVAASSRLRSKGFVGERTRLERAVSAREEVLRVVRDAEGGVGAHGLDALRGEYPSLSLAADLALAKHGAPGFAAAARDRVLSACVDELGRFLSRNRGWDAVTIAVSPYGESENVDAFLSGPDPSRCQGRGSAPKKKR